MSTTDLLLSGATAGLSIAVPIGPLGLLCIERSLRSGFRAGFSTGLGGVTVNAGFALLLLIGVHGVLPLLDGGSRTLGTLGGLFLLWSAVRVLTRPMFGTPARRPGAPAAAGSAYWSAVAYNASNPLSLVLVLAALSPTIGDGPVAPGEVATLLTGMVLAASTWWALLSYGAGALRSRLSPAVLTGANRLAGALLGAYAALALLRAWSA